MPKLTDKELLRTYGPWAVVTGASSGIGEEYALQLSQLGFCLVLIARRVDRLRALGEEILRRHPDLSVKCIAVDLRSPNALTVIDSKLDELDVGLLVNNAGKEVNGNFLLNGRNNHERIITLNTLAFTQLCHYFGRRFAARDKTSGMIAISSMINEAFPYFSTSAASKAFVSELSIALRAEWKQYNIHVTVMEPGTVKSEMYERESRNFDFKQMGYPIMTTEDFVKRAMKAFAKGKARCTPGTKNKMMRFVTRCMPEKTRLAYVMKVVEKNAAPHATKYDPLLAASEKD